MVQMEPAPRSDGPLVAAVKLNDADAVAAALKEPATNLHAADAEKEKGALLLAAKLGHLAIVETLIGASFTTNATEEDSGGWSAAMHAAAGGHTDVLAALVANDGAACLVAPEGCSLTPLLVAALKGRTACAALILDTAANAADAADAHGRNALHLAATGGSVAMVELLVQRGSKIDATSTDGKTALMWAILSHKLDAVGALARLGADPTPRDIPRPDAPVVPGKVHGQGDDALDLATGRRDKDPTLRHIAKYLREWIELRTAEPGAPAPPMPPLPWVSHAEAWVAAGGDAAPAEEEAATGAADAADDSDIFGDDDIEEVDNEDTLAEDDSKAKGEAAAAMAAVAAADLDDLD